MRIIRRRCVAVAVLAALLASACGGSRSDDEAGDQPTEVADDRATNGADDPAGNGADEPDTDDGDGAADGDDPGTDSADDDGGTDAGEPATDDGTAEPAATFGDLAWPCGPGEVPNTDDGAETGVTATTVRIGGGDDAGLVSDPGLFHEMTDAMEAFVARCNELGGINGRTITFEYYDAAVFDIGAAIQAACDDDLFFLVGEGWAFDSAQEETRLGCGLPAVPGITTAAAFANGPLMHQAVPNPADEYNAGGMAALAELYPAEAATAGAFVSNFAASLETREKFLQAAPSVGWTFVTSEIVYNPAGEADWTPFVRQLQDAGVGLVRYAGTCLALQQFMQTARANGYDPVVFTDTNAYAAECAASNADGALDRVHMSLAFTPFEEADANPATQQFLDLLEASGGDAAVLGMQAASSFLLWATAADACGATLTRSCVLEQLAATTEWTGGGLHAPTDPGGNHPTSCDVLIRLDGTGYVRVAPPEEASFRCDPAAVVPISGTAALEAAALDENRLATQFAPGG